MFEALLTTGMKRGIVIPNSGPGPITLISGTEAAGYFGLVSPTDVFYQTDMALATKLTSGVPSSPKVPTFGWWKFIYAGKIYFMPNDMIRDNVSWTDIYNAGLVYGVDGNGKYPTATPTNQYTTVSSVDTKNRANTYLVQLPSGAPTDPETRTTIPFNSQGLFTELLRMVPDLLINQNNLDNTRIGEYQYSQTSSSVTTNAIGVGATLANGTRGISVSKAATTYGWRPILEWLPGTRLYSPYKLYSQFVGNTGPLSVTGQFVDVVYPPKAVIFDDGGQASPPNVTSVTIVDAVRAATNARQDMSIKPFTITISKV